MKVSMLGTLPPLKGNAYYCWHLCEAMSKKIEVEFFSFSRLYPDFLYPGGTKDSDENCAVKENERLKIHRTINFCNPWSWAKTALRVSSDLVHVQFWSMPVVPIWITILSILRHRGKKIIVTVHNVNPHEPSALDTMLTRSLLKLADRYIVHVEENIQHLHELYSIHRELVTQIHMGTHGTAYKNSNNTYSPLEAKKVLGLEETAKVILFFGNIREYKGIDDFIEALAVVRQLYNGKVVGLIVGQPWGKFDKYQQLISAHGLDENIKTWLHYIPMTEVSKFFQASDVVVLPYTKMDGQSGVGNIALDFYKPMVVTNVGGLPELVLNRDFVVEPNQPQQMAERIFRIIQNEEVSRQLAEDAKILGQIYSWDAISDKAIAVYRSLLKD